MCYYASKFPGPPAYPIIGNAPMFFGSHEESTYNLINISNEYSLFRVWLGPIPIIATSNPEIIQELLTNKDVLEKPSLMKTMWEIGMGKSILISNVSEWKRNRSIVIRGFSPIILKSYFRTFKEKIYKLTKKLDLELNKETSFDICEYLTRVTLELVCVSTMGVNIKVDEHESSYFNAVHSAMYLMMVRVFNIFKIPTILYRLTEDYKKASISKDILQGFTDKIITEKRKQFITENNNLIDFEVTDKYEHKKPLLEHLMDFTRNNSQFTDEQLRNEINTIIMAAYETSATTISHILLLLAVYKDIQTQVYNELLKVLGKKNQDSIDYDDLSKLTYMDMVIKESMRFITTVPLISRKPSKDIKIGNQIIPKGITVAIPIFTVHRSKNYWKYPLRFLPERFESDNIKNIHPYAYIPFSAGPRNCIGKTYSWMVIKTALIILLSRYEFHTDLKLNELRFEIAISSKLINGHQVRITLRQKANKRLQMSQ